MIILSRLALMVAFSIYPCCANADYYYSSFADCSGSAPAPEVGSLYGCPLIDRSSKTGLPPNFSLDTRIVSMQRDNFDAKAAVRSGPGNLGVFTNTTLKGKIESTEKAYVKATATAQFFDTIQVTSNSVPIGGYVQLTLSELLSFDTTRRGSYLDRGNPETGAYARLRLQLTVFSSSGDNFTINNCYDRVRGDSSCVYLPSDGLQSFNFSRTINAQVGGYINIGKTLSASSYSYLYNATTGSFEGSSFAEVSSLNSAHTYLSTSNSDAILSAESGHIYSVSAIPEPATWMLSLVGLGLISRTRRRSVVSTRKAERRSFVRT